MALFLNEALMRQYLLSEADDKKAPGDEDEEEKKPDPKKDSAADNKDSADTDEDSGDADDADAEPADDSEDAGGAPPAEDDGAAPTDGAVPEASGVQPAKKLQAIASKEGLQIDDTAHNRTFMLEKYHEVIRIYENMLTFASTLNSKFPSDAKRIEVLDFITTKIESNLEMLNKALDDQIFVNMDITSLFALYKIYFNDATSVNKTIKLVVSYQNAK